MQMDKEQYGKAKACLVSCMQEGYSWQVAKAQAKRVCRSVSRMCIDCGGPSVCIARRRSPMDDTVIRASYGVQHGLFSKNDVGKLLQPLHPPSRWNCNERGSGPLTTTPCSRS